MILIAFVPRSGDYLPRLKDGAFSNMSQKVKKETYEIAPRETERLRLFEASSVRILRFSD
jgi:hypothetical protein